MSYREVWERELRDRKSGQDRQRPGTWKMDALYRAMLWELRADEAEGILALALEQGAHPDSIAELVDEVHREREMADKIFVEGTEAERAAA